ncbi:MAG: MetQ/NlpA family ABC transporter substrate-binding protein [Treponema sp.]|nr:MetQ/NlpA family ABC transporter substrate-binding protein [Treponema sp.]
MKKQVISLLAIGVLLIGLGQNLEAFGRNQRDASTLVVGATPVPHAELLNLIAEDLAAQGFTLRVVEFTDYVQPNRALMSGDLDANFFQHLPYLQTNEEWNTRLAPAFGVHVEPFGLYSQRHNSIAALPNGATIAIPNDPTNGGRALLLLQANGLITLRPDAGLQATPRDIVGNPRNFQFQELEAAQLPRALADVDAATINGNFALQAGFNPVRDSLIIEGADSPYVNYVVVQRGAENDPRIIALRNVLHSQRVRDHINASYGGGVVATF